MTDATQPRMARGKKLTAGIVAAALFALLAFAPFASAASDPVGSGTTTVNLSNKFTKYLKTFGIKIQKNGSSKVKGNKATFTVTEGSVDPTTGLGSFKLGGGLKVNAGKKSATIGNMTVNTTKKEISAKVSGKKMKFATIAGWSQARKGFGVTITIKSLKLTGPAAQQLNKKTGYAKGKPKPFIGGFVIGKGSSEIQPATVGVVATGSASLALAPQALAKLQHVGTPPYPEGASPVAVNLEPVSPTTFDVPTLTAAFPFGEGGTIAPSGTAGTLKTVGGLKLIQNLESLGSGVTTLTMGNIWVDMGAKTASVEVSIENPSFEAGKGPNLGNLGRASIADIDLSGATITPNETAHTISVSGAKATLQAVTAATLNQVFIEGLESASPVFEGQEKFAAGDPLGTISFTVQTE
jgi:hypothetical protein